MHSANGTKKTKQALRAKEDALRCTRGEARAKDLEIASLCGDLAGEARLRTAAEFKLEEACSQREEVQGVGRGWTKKGLLCTLVCADLLLKSSIQYVSPFDIAALPRERHGSAFKPRPPLSRFPKLQHKISQVFLNLLLCRVPSLNICGILLIV